MGITVDGNYDAYEAYNTAMATKISENLGVPYDPVNPWNVEKLKPGESFMLYGRILIINKSGKDIDIKHGFDLHDGGFYSKVYDQDGNLLLEARNLSMETKYAFGFDEKTGEYVMNKANAQALLNNNDKLLANENTKRSSRYLKGIEQKG